MDNPIVTVHPEIQSGAPVFSGTRVPVQSLFDYLSDGDSLETYLSDFPGVKREQALQAIALAGELLQSTSKSLLNEKSPIG